MASANCNVSSCKGLGTVTFEGKRTDRFATTVRQHSGHRRCAGRFRVLRQRSMGNRHGAFRRGQQRIGDAAALLDRLIHRILDRICTRRLSRLKLAECDTARRRTVPFRLTMPSDTRSHCRRVANSLVTAIAIPFSRGCAPTAARRSRHDCGSCDIGREILGAPRPGQCLEPARAPAQLFGDDCRG